MQYLSASADLCTVAGFLFAVIIYLLWEHDYGKQKCSEYALDWLKKFKLLHHAIENLRAPKLYHQELIEKVIEEHYIPKINELIISKVISIQADLLIAENILLKNKSLLNEFNTLIKDQIISKISGAVNNYFYEKKSVDLKKRKLWLIIFPSDNEEAGFKKSVLGTNEEVVNDDFNKVIENNFQKIYALLENELTTSTTPLRKLLNYYK